MGYKSKPKVYKLVFDETTEYPGLEVQVRTLTMGQLMQVWSGGGTNAGTYEMFLERVIGWNVEDEATGEPVPVTREAIEGQDDDMIQAIVSRWTSALIRVPDPLESNSPSGVTSPVESVLTEIPSQSLAS